MNREIRRFYSAMSDTAAETTEATYKGATNNGRMEGNGVYTFPTGTIRFGSDTLAAIGRSAGGGWDIDLIADAYRAQMGERLAKLKGAKLIASWTGFCESFLARRGRP